jgi:vacuolar-type H+-ATPase subunit F/Vma7
VNVCVLGDADDARGFTLAGWPAVPCPDAAAAERALGSAAARRDLALVVVSADVAALAAGGLTALRAQADAPLVLVLP